jgi:adenylate cyclase
VPSGLEIERKFLVREPPDELDRYPSDDIEQGYLAVTDDGVEVRIRHYGDRALLTVKSGGGGSRVEEEFEIDERRFRSLWSLTEGRRIEKSRYRIPATAGATIELDIYRGALEGLMTAEVEFGSSDAAAGFAPPDWFGPEVTDDPAYKNQRLATDGLPADRG